MTSFGKKSSQKPGLFCSIVPPLQPSSSSSNSRETDQVLDNKNLCFEAKGWHSYETECWANFLFQAQNQDAGSSPGIH